MRKCPYVLHTYPLPLGAERIGRIGMLKIEMEALDDGWLVTCWSDGRQTIRCFAETKEKASAIAWSFLIDEGMA